MERLSNLPVSYSRPYSMWNLVVGITIILIFLFAVCFGTFKQIKKSRKDAVYRPRDFENVSVTPNNLVAPEELSENQRPNTSPPLTVINMTSNGTPRKQSLKLVKSIPLPTYEELAPPSYDVALRLSMADDDALE
ncbi:hypothetical protein CEXT_768071 [Caerostris extrusa]|uniref:Uncharacterized protein n=1 Tax=Caerostris extrusa TaxID=172846 RepID=A0AAV4V0E1_CAEEX|nr:hypothetical protein CEXT_768071 [Caerostris extrusa]